MKELLLSLGRRPSLGHRVWLVSLFVVVTLSFLAGGHIWHAFVQWRPLSIQMAGWVIWFTWQGWLFPLNRERYIQSEPTRAYQKAFYRDILPGVSFGVSQMLRPVSYEFLSTPAFPPYCLADMCWLLGCLHWLYAALPRVQNYWDCWGKFSLRVSRHPAALNAAQCVLLHQAPALPRRGPSVLWSHYSPP
jgi:hypothetical protein